ESLTSNNGNLMLQANRNITLNHGASIQTSSGGITLNANQQATPRSGNFRGIFVNEATITSATGAILLQGKGGHTGRNSNTGISLTFGAVVSSTGTGAGAATITLSGTGGPGTGSNEGIAVSHNSSITSKDGAIGLTGTGGAGTGTFNFGILVGLGAQVSA